MNFRTCIDNLSDSSQMLTGLDNVQMSCYVVQFNEGGHQLIVTDEPVEFDK
jgi:hypothetical protein